MKRRNDEDERAVAVPRPAAEPPEPAANDRSGPSGLEPVPLPSPSREEHEALRRERDELKDRYLRKAAEFDNYRKRAERDRQQVSLETSAALLQDVIPTLDNLERALAAQASASSLREGVELTHRELLGLLESKGVSVEDPVGQVFDPSSHQALAYEPAPGFPDGTVTEVLRKGYRLGDRLLRPALVKVARGLEGGDGAGGDKVH